MCNGVNPIIVVASNLAPLAIRSMHISRSPTVIERCNGDLLWMYLVFTYAENSLVAGFKSFPTFP